MLLRFQYFIFVVLVAFVDINFFKSFRPFLLFVVVFFLFLLLFKKTFFSTVKDSCVPNPCNNEAICTEMDDGYHCTCKLGYKGDQCQSKRISHNRDIWSATKITYLLICLHKQTRFVELT